MRKDFRKRDGSLEAGPDPKDTSRRAFFGAIALGGVNFGRFGLQLLVLPIIARILGPASFGLISLAMPFILFANMLSDAGMGAALIREARPSSEVESTVFWMSIAVASAIGLCIWLIAAPVAGLVHQPRMAVILMALSPILMLSSSLSVANARIARTRNFALFAVGDFLSVTLSSGATILAALHGFGAWSLVIQQLVLWTTKAAWILPTSRFRPRFVFRPSLIKGLLGFGLNNVGANIADFMGKSAPALVIGGLLGVIAVGHYSMAYQLIRIPDIILSGPLYLATYTAIVGAGGRPGGAAQLSMRTLRVLVSVLAPLFCGLALVSDLATGLFLGSKWRDAAPVLSALAPGGLLMCLYGVAGAVLMGLGRSDLQFRLSLSCGLAMLFGAMLGSRFGVEGATVGISLGAAVASPLYVRALSKQLGASWRNILSNIAWPLIASAVMALAVALTRRELAGSDRWLQLAASVIIGALVFGATLSVTSGRQIREDLRQALPTKA